MPSFSYETFDPIVGESFFGWSMYDPLLTWDENFEICGGIAESWDMSSDANTWTFHIRQGVKFHNGDPLTSADVMFSVAHWQDPSSTNPWSPYLSYNFDSMSCPDDYTFVYKTKKPELAMAIIFTDVRILPKKYIEENGLEYFRKNPIGSGPWKFVSFTSGESCIMDANTEHWRTVPHYSRLVQLVVPEESTQVAMLKRGEVDIITGITLDTVCELRDDGFRLVPPPYPDGVMLCMPGTWLPEAGPTHDIRVRHALAYAINYQELCDTFFRGFAVPGGRWFSYPGVWGWDDSWQPEQYDLAKAKSLLAEAGYPDAFEDPIIDIYVQIGTGYTPDLMQVLQGYWTAAGIQTEIHMVDPFEYLGLFFFGATDPAGDNIGAIIPWAFYISWPNNVYHSYNMYCPGGVHATSNDQHAGELYDRAVSQTDPDLMEQYWKEFQTYVHDELFINFGVCLVYPPMVVGPEVGDFGYGQWISIADAYADIGHK
jgi:peptide/nickel transport system substrate-binding protein